MNTKFWKLTAAALALAISVPALSAEVDRRQANQQRRIANGIQNGNLNANQAARLENREAAIHNEVKAERAANGGHLTAGERAKVNRQENRTSRAIYNAKH